MRVGQGKGGQISPRVHRDWGGRFIGTAATVPASLVAKGWTAFVNTLSPHSGAGTNGLSNALAFIINPPGNPLTAVSSISPSCTVAGGAVAFTLTVTGTNFVMNADPTQASQVLWGEGGTQTTLATVSGGSATQITAALNITPVPRARKAVWNGFDTPGPNAARGDMSEGHDPPQR